MRIPSCVIHQIHLLLSLSFVCNSLAAENLTAQPARAIEYQETMDELVNLAPMSSRVATVRDLVLERGAARLVLSSGELFQLSEVDGRVIGVVFVGSGAFLFDPPLGVEREQLLQIYGSSELDQHFGALLLLFGDSTMAELEDAVTFSEGAVPDEARDLVETALDYLTSSNRQQFKVEVLATVLNREQNGFVYAHMIDPTNDPVIFEINPFIEEGVLLYRPQEGRRSDPVLELVCRFASSDPASTASGLLTIDQYAIESDISNGVDFSAAATVRVSSSNDSLRWAPLILHSALRIDSVFDEQGRAVSYAREDEGTLLWLNFEPALPRQMERVVTMFYHGGIIRRFENTHIIRTSATWYPRHGGREGATFDLTFHTPVRLAFASVGRMVSSEEDGVVRTTRWITDKPLRSASFVLGAFDEYEVDYEDIPHTTVLSRPRPIRSATGLSLQAQVSADLANSLRFFRDRFGEPLQDDFIAAEIPYLHGEAFPGLVHLSLATFLDQHESIEHKLFRAHEMAHQWWGVGVDIVSYRDRWLIEGLAEFSALWFLDEDLGDHDGYEETLRDWRDQLVGRGSGAAPIAFGGRGGAEAEVGDDELISYRKGAWVLHMLRELMSDGDAGRDDRFTSMLKDFYSTYRGKRASTDDFKSVVEKHIGADMTRFFDQWVNGSAIPSYRFSHTVDESADGTFVVHVIVQQDDVPEEFSSSVPIRLEFEGGGSTMYSAVVRGQLTQIDLPGQATLPNAVRFNFREAVLASTVHVPWHGGRIRVMSPTGEWFAGRLGPTDKGSVTIAADDPRYGEPASLALDPEMLQSLQMSNKSDLRLLGLFVGAAVGAGGGVMWGRRPTDQECHVEWLNFNSVEREIVEVCLPIRSTPRTVLAGVTSALAGGLVGYWLGSQIQIEHWTPFHWGALRSNGSGVRISAIVPVRLGESNGSRPPMN